MFELSSETKITKELLLKNHTEEQFMEHYLGIPVKKGLQVSPLRSDKLPTASFFRDKKNNLIFHDFQGDFHGNFISVVMKLFSCSYYKALHIIANDFSIIETKGYEKNAPKIEYSGIKFTEKQATSKLQVTIKEFSKKELDWWNSFGISKNTLKKFKVFSCQHTFLNGIYYNSSTETSPIYGYFGGFKDDIELWRLYMPTRKTYRFLANWSASFIQGSKQLPKSNDYLIITKSLKDVMSLYEANLVSIAPCSENIIIAETVIKRLIIKYKILIVLMDNDLAGVKAAKKYKKAYGLKCVFIKRKYSKDISDLYKKKGLMQFLDASEELLSITKDPNIKQTKYFYVF